MYKKIILIVASFFAVCSSSNALECPKMPEQYSKDWSTTFDAAVAKIRAVSGAELKGAVQSATQEMLAKLPNADKVYIEQMIFATYCTAIRDDKNISDDAKANKIKQYREVQKAAKTSPQIITANPPKPHSTLDNAPAASPSYPVTFNQTSYSFGQGIVSFNNDDSVTVDLTNTTDVTGFGITNKINLSGYRSITVTVAYNPESNFTWGGKLFKLDINNRTVRAKNDEQDKSDPNYARAMGVLEQGKIIHTYTFDLPPIEVADKLQIAVAAANKSNLKFTAVRLIN